MNRRAISCNSIGRVFSNRSIIPSEVHPSAPHFWCPSTISLISTVCSGYLLASAITHQRPKTEAPPTRSVPQVSSSHGEDPLFLLYSFLRTKRLHSLPSVSHFAHRVLPLFYQHRLSGEPATIILYLPYAQLLMALPNSTM